MPILSSTTTTSVWSVCGNISTGLTETSLWLGEGPLHSSARSRARVAGLQLTYTSLHQWAGRAVAHGYSPYGALMRAMAGIVRRCGLRIGAEVRAGSPAPPDLYRTMTRPWLCHHHPTPCGFAARLSNPPGHAQPTCARCSPSGSRPQAWTAPPLLGPPPPRQERRPRRLRPGQQPVHTRGHPARARVSERVAMALQRCGPGSWGAHPVGPQRHAGATLQQGASWNRAACTAPTS